MISSPRVPAPSRLRAIVFHAVQQQEPAGDFPIDLRIFTGQLGLFR